MQYYLTLTAIRNICFFLMVIAGSHAHAAIIKCKEADASVFYATHIDAITLVERSGVTCEGLGRKDKENKKSKQSYERFILTKSKIKGVNAIKLSDLHRHIHENLPSDSMSDIDLWVNSFPPFNEGVAIQYPTVFESTKTGEVVEVSRPSCDGGYGGILFEKESYSEKYIGQNAYGAIAKVREETTIQYCLIDLSAHRAKFQLLKSKKINKNNLVVVGRGRIDLSIKDEYSSHKPTFNVPLDSVSAIHQFKMHAEEYLLVNRKTGEILDRQSAHP